MGVMRWIRVSDCESKRCVVSSRGGPGCRSTLQNVRRRQVRGDPGCLRMLGDARRRHVRFIAGCLCTFWDARRRDARSIPGCLCTLRDARRRQARKELVVVHFVTAGQFKRWSPTGILCTPSVGAHALLCDMTDSPWKTLVIIFSSRLLNLAPDCVCASFLCVCLGLSRSPFGVSLGCSIVGVGGECHWRFLPLPPPCGRDF